MAHCPIAQLIGPNLSALLCGDNDYQTRIIISISRD
jgi:hypothetical protein